MNTLIIGAGAIGIAAGTALQAAGASVTFLARGETKTAMEQGGIHRTGLLGEAHSQPDQFSVTDSYGYRRSTAAFLKQAHFCVPLM